MDDADILERFKERGLRPTHQRIALYRYLATHPCHPTAETVFQALQPQLPSCSLMTVYNGLAALENAGLLQVITIDAAHKRFDADVNPHGHFRCDCCGTVYDFPLPAINMQSGALSGFVVEKTDFYCSGICRTCAKNGTVEDT